MAALNSISLKHYSLQAWLLAIGVSLIPAGARLETYEMVYAGLVTVVIAAAVWCVRKRFQLRTWLRAAAVLLWLWNALLFLNLPLSIVYSEPRLHRAYAEWMGMDMDDALLLAIGCSVAITLIALGAPRLLGGNAAGRRVFVRVLCAGTPIALAALALAAYAYVPEFRSIWPVVGFDLPFPTRVLLAGQPYWALLPLPALALGAYAWTKADENPRLKGALYGLLALLFLGGALASFVVSAIYLAGAPMCGGAV